MTNIIDNMLSLCPVSEDTIQELKKCMILCRFPKKYQLIKENTFCKSAYFIEKGMAFFLACKWRRNNNLLFMGRRYCFQYGRVVL